MKICSKCKAEKEESAFCKDKSKKDGLNSWCKDCAHQNREKNKDERRPKSKKYYEENKESILERKKIWRINNKEKIAGRDKQYLVEHREKINDKNRRWRKNNPEKLKKSKKLYYENNKEEILANRKHNYKENNEEIKKQRKLWDKRNRKNITAKEKERRKNDINYRISCNLRSRLNSALKNNQKSGSAVRDLGCTIAELKTWLEQQFQPGMTWENYGEWEIDHILPLSKFDLGDRKQLLKVCNWFNLQPLWAEDNIKKGNKVDIIENK